MSWIDGLVALLATALAGCGQAPVAIDGGATDASLEPDGGVDAALDAAIPCSGEPGTFRARSIEVDGETRFYYLHVPAAYSCDTPAWPALFDLHGTAGATPEEAYGLEAAVAAAEREGFVLVRPRSRSSVKPGFGEVYRWDQNPGDPQRNRRFIRVLAARLASEYHLDADRLFAMGFSSGTNQVAELAAERGTPFDGFGFVGGGAWTTSTIEATRARYYLNTGFRDYMRPYHDALVAQLDAASVAPTRRLVSESDAGHDLYGWMYDELWAFLARGERPAPPAGAREAWTDELTGTDATLLALAALPSGEVIAVGERSSVLVRDASGAWSARAPSGTSRFAGAALTAVCARADGLALAVGGGLVVRSTDAGASWRIEPAAPDAASGFGYAHLNGVACGESSIVAGGYWSAVSTTDGLAWRDVSIDGGGYRAQVASVRASPWGTFIAAGYYAYVARSTDAVRFQPALPGASVEWALDAAPVAASTWIVVGDGGHVLRSVDDGERFTPVGRAGEDLYAVAFRGDAMTGLAVGRRCAALLTRDGGASWEDASCDRPVALTDVAWLPDGTALVSAERGIVLRFDPS